MPTRSVMDAEGGANAVPTRSVLDGASDSDRIVQCLPRASGRAPVAPPSPPSAPRRLPITACTRRQDARRGVRSPRY